MICTKRQVVDELADDYDHPLVVLDGLDEALIGLATVPGQPIRLAYDVGQIIEIVMSWGCTQEEAEEYYSFNIECLYIGEGTPVLVDGRAFNGPMQ